MFDLLREPLLPVSGGGRDRETLPGVLARLSAGEDLGFPGLAAHQRQSWFCFLVQLAALALTAAGRGDAPDTEAGWLVLLEALAGEEADTAFALVAPPARPAFLQPPVRAAALAKFRGPVLAADAIDILIVAKNHDLKLERVTGGEAHHWAYALVNLQTMQGFLGRGNYGIARMNGGFSARVLAGRQEGGGWALRFRHDLRLLLATRGRLLAAMNFYRESGGLALLWLEPWDEEEAIPVQGLDPYFIEICRRVRLVEQGGRIGALLRPSETARLAAAAFKGALGDPWAPVDSVAGTAFTVPAAGLDHQRIVKILTDRRGLPVALKPYPGEGEGNLDLHFTVLVRGQGRTDGLHERVVPIPRVVADGLEDEEMSHYLAARADEMQKDAAAALAALRLGLRIYLQGAPETLKQDDDRPHVQAEGLGRAVDRHFLDHLWAQVAPGDGVPDPHRAWLDWLRQAAIHWFKAGLSALPPPVNRREKAHFAALNVFHSRLNKALPPEEKTA
ncbi:type I-E CRISPR-associated protein Cse1/CasA [Zavarzinia compransoris]|uniref:Type I-E CRISPR-associated protein Cse1/CasA n=1 Tax=Zavarzinia compransoris TaxID=1264899 RepID=A0A317DXY6_9PROT|nr:type I-E CRISPR-associated protein Cse1/CasA [Zavarzinia compransoris]PWR18800.1 type I-E CRISPR-associated protein Cse1/CasA [Zavarzinia compransoris]TDP48786.1 CRISPR-associated Cse1 family protein [Zavarzinia compransoris]